MGKGVIRNKPFRRVVLSWTALLAWPGAASAQAVPVGTSRPAEGTADAAQFELAFWQSVANSGDRAQLRAYLAQYPGGAFAALARLKIAALDRETGTASRAEPVATHRPAMAADDLLPPAAPGRVMSGSADTSATAGAEPAAAPQPASRQAAGSALARTLRELGQAQGAHAEDATRQVALPPRPVLATLADLTLPGSFCSAQARNDFHERSYTPLVAQADRNNLTAIAHMDMLRARFDAAKARADYTGMNRLALEAQSYEEVAQRAYQARAALDGVFSRIMSTPLAGCQEG